VTIFNVKFLTAWTTVMLLSTATHRYRRYRNSLSSYNNKHTCAIGCW